MVRWKDGRLTATPYRVEYRAFLEPAARALREAAGLSDDPAFANFLRLRADALLTDDYYASDLAWLDLHNPKFDVIFAPYETYLDDLLGVKTSYGAAVLIRNEAESRKPGRVSRSTCPIFRTRCRSPPPDRPSKRGHLSPMEVMDSPFRAGDLRHGYQAVADNLPNDPRIHAGEGHQEDLLQELHGRAREVRHPAHRAQLMRAGPGAACLRRGLSGWARCCTRSLTASARPSRARDGKQVDIREAIGAVYSGLEEAKADVVGMFGLAWLVNHGALPKEKLAESTTRPTSRASSAPCASAPAKRTAAPR